MGGEPPYCSRREPRALARRRVDYELTDRLCQGDGVPTRTPIFLQTLILWFSGDRVERSHGQRVRLRALSRDTARVEVRAAPCIALNTKKMG